MATPESLAIRRAAALERVTSAIETIAESLGVAIAPFPDPHKRVELRPVQEAEWIADTLGTVLVAIGGSDLDAMTRRELNAHAAALGIDGADKLPNKGAVIEAITEATAKPADASETPESDATDGDASPDAELPMEPNVPSDAVESDAD